MKVSLALPLLISLCADTGSGAPGFLNYIAEWGYVYAGSILPSAVNEDGQFQVSKLEVGDIWYFPKGEAHTVQGLEDENEFLLVFDDGNFDAVGTTFNLDDWIAHTPVSFLAKNFNLSESVFGNVPSPNPYIQNGTLSPQDQDVTGGNGPLTGNASYVYYAKDHPLEKVPGRGGTLRIVDTTTFPIATTIAATVVTLEPGGLRELHWHPNAAEWLYFHKGQARAGVFIGNSNARTFDFSAGDTALFPDNSGEHTFPSRAYAFFAETVEVMESVFPSPWRNEQLTVFSFLFLGNYIENVSPAEELVWIETYKSDRVKDISLTQWLALTPANIVADILRIPLDVAKSIKKEKQILIK
ncbi:hypothetical protein PG988_012131 [Apiospora saccharicola]